MRYRQSIRHVAGLISADFSSGPTSAPAWAKSRRKAKGARAKGFSFERAVHKELVRLGVEHKFSQWIRFFDTNGGGFAQPDFIITLPRAGAVLVLEAKYTYTDSAWEQLERLYVPLVRKLYPGKTVYTVQVCKVLVDVVPLADILSFLDNPCLGRVTWHFLGR